MPATKIRSGSTLATKPKGGATPTGQTTKSRSRAKAGTNPRVSAPATGQTNETRPPAILQAKPSVDSPGDGYLELRVLAEMLFDAQQAHTAASNRAKRAPVDPIIYEAQLVSLEHAEHEIALALRRTFRRVASESIREWQKDNNGIGEHLLARLLGAIGHPVVTTTHHWEGKGEKRTLIADGVMHRRVSDLWSYCGHGDPTRKARKGMSAEEATALGSPAAKMIVHLLAKACMKTRTSPYRKVYDDARTTYATREHATECVRCGPSGKPAQPGSPWSPGHQHAAALRKVGKEILRDLWMVARIDVEAIERP